MKYFNAVIKTPKGSKVSAFFVILTRNQWDYWKSCEKCMTLFLPHRERKLGVLLVLNPDPNIVPREEEADEIFPDSDISIINAHCNQESIPKMESGLFESFELTPDYALVVMVGDTRKPKKVLIQDFISRCERFPSPTRDSPFSLN